MLPDDFKASMRGVDKYTFDGKITDLNVNTSQNIKYTRMIDGEPVETAYPKKAGQTYIDISVEILNDPDKKGKKFVQENINTSIFVGMGKKSPMYMLLLHAGISQDSLDILASQIIPDFNFNDLVGRTIGCVRERKDGGFYLDLRDHNANDAKTTPQAGGIEIGGNTAEARLDLDKLADAFSSDSETGGQTIDGPGKKPRKQKENKAPEGFEF